MREQRWRVVQDHEIDVRSPECGSQVSHEIKAVRQGSPGWQRAVQQHGDIEVAVGTGPAGGY